MNSITFFSALVFALTLLCGLTRTLSVPLPDDNSTTVLSVVDLGPPEQYVSPGIVFNIDTVDPVAEQETNSPADDGQTTATDDPSSLSMAVFPPPEPASDSSAPAVASVPLVTPTPAGNEILTDGGDLAGPPMTVPAAISIIPAIITILLPSPTPPPPPPSSSTLTTGTNVPADAKAAGTASASARPTWAAPANATDLSAYLSTFNISSPYDRKNMRLVQGIPASASATVAPSPSPSPSPPPSPSPSSQPKPSSGSKDGDGGEDGGGLLLPGLEPLLGGIVGVVDGPAALEGRGDMRSVFFPVLAAPIPQQPILLVSPDGFILVGDTPASALQSGETDQPSNVANATATATPPAERRTTTTTTTTTTLLTTMAVYPTMMPVSEQATPPTGPIGFTGIFFSTFFGGHGKKYATPKNQYVWFKDFSLIFNA